MFNLTRFGIIPSTITYGTIDGTLLHTIADENAYGTEDSDEFGTVTAICNSYSIVGVYLEDDAGGTSSGKAYIYTNETGALLYTLNNPNPYGTSAGDSFGWSVDITESYAIVGAYLEDDAGGTSSGKAYIYDMSDGSLLYTLDNENAYDTSADDQFGFSVGICEKYAIVGAYLEDGPVRSSEGKAYVYDMTDGSLLYTFSRPVTDDDQGSPESGQAVSICDQYALVGTHQQSLASGVIFGGIAHVYDMSDGSLLYTLDNPTPVTSDVFGSSVAITKSYAIVGAFGVDLLADQAGAVYIFDMSDGSLLHTIENPLTANTLNDYFGLSVDISESYSIIGGPNMVWDGSKFAGMAYIHDNLTGTLLYTLHDNSNTLSKLDMYGQSVSICEKYAIVGAPDESTDTSSTEPGVVYIYN